MNLLNKFASLKKTFKLKINEKQKQKIENNLVDDSIN